MANKRKGLHRDPPPAWELTSILSLEELCLIVTNDFSCPTHVYTLCFEDAKHQQTFLNSFIEARTKYQQLQSGSLKSDPYLEALDAEIGKKSIFSGFRQKGYFKPIIWRTKMKSKTLRLSWRQEKALGNLMFPLDLNHLNRRLFLQMMAEFGSDKRTISYILQ